MLTTKDIAWAAGFLEGEGSFLYAQGLRIACPQVQREPLERLQRIFGGVISRYDRPGGVSGALRIHTWYLRGTAAAGTMMTLLGLMSPRRVEQIVAALDKWKVAPQANKAKTQCPLGHPYAPRKGGRYCPTCRRALDRRPTYTRVFGG